MLRSFALCSLLAASVPAPVAAAAPALPAFPGAEGFGSDTPGGRGGRVIAVTTLAADGPGSFKAALEAEGPRIVVFRVGGTIALNGRVRIREPFLTVAGQTAPGDGLQIKGGTLAIQTHDVVLRGLRVRAGDREGADPEDRDCVEMGVRDGAVHHVVIDHCSLSWAIDETVSTWYRGVSDITVQWSVISETLFASRHPKGRHSRGFLIGDFSQRITTHHCLFAHNDFRNPEFKGDTRGEVLNNVIYNWGQAGTDFGEGDETHLPDFVSIIGNTYLPGRDSQARQAILIRDTGKWALHPDSRIHLADNAGGQRIGGDALLAPVPATPFSNVRLEPASLAAGRVLREAGATAPRRDTVDARIVRDATERTGRIIDSQEQVGGWPALAGGDAPADSDRDGMPDAWELARDLDPENPADGPGDRDGDGYTNVEEYLNSFFPPSNSAVPPS